MDDPAADSVDGRRCEGNPPFGIFEELFDVQHLILFEEALAKEVPVELYSDLMDVSAGAFVRKPSVGKIGADKDELFIAHLSDVVPDDALGTGRTEYEVKLHLFMTVQGESEFAFCPGEDGKTIVVGKGGNFPY